MPYFVSEEMREIVACLWSCVFFVLSVGGQVHRSKGKRRVLGSLKQTTGCCWASVSYMAHHISRGMRAQVGLMEFPAICGKHEDRYGALLEIESGVISAFHPIFDILQSLGR